MSRCRECGQRLPSDTDVQGREMARLTRDHEETLRLLDERMERLNETARRLRDDIVSAAASR